MLRYRYWWCVLFVFASPAVAQERIFRASPIDIQQDARLDALEDRLAIMDRDIFVKLEEIEQKVTAKPVALATAPVKKTATVTAYVAPAPKPAASSSRYTTEDLRSMIQQKRPGGWRGAVYADVSPRSGAKQHLVGAEHGFSWDQVDGLTQDEALILHDLAPRHGNQIFPTRPTQGVARSQPVTVSKPVVQPVRHVTQAVFGGCANGQCARGARPAQPTRRTGWRLFR